MDTFFDFMNVKNIDEHQFKRKLSLALFSSPDDPSFL